MYFKRLEMHGFKSFADPVVIEFHEGVTCVVGPNGSGKSNISDAIRWVLGEQSPKTLRGGKMEEVIFAGSASRKLRGMAEVTLVIDNSKGILDIDYSEVSITRRMFRSGESEYLINNVPCRLRDIRELIMDTGIGVDGYSIIGQGKIADIVSNKPESRREIFEEAAGVVSYKTRKAEAERRLETTNANLLRANDIIGEIESRIDSLKNDSERAVEYLDLKKKYESTEVNVILKNMENLQNRSNAMEEDILHLANDIKNETGNIAEVEKVLENAEGSIREIDKRADISNRQLLEVIQMINQEENRKKITSQKEDFLSKEKLQLSEEIDSVTEKLTDEELKLREGETTLEQLIQVAKSNEINLDNKLKEYEKLYDEDNILQKEINEKKDLIIRLSGDISKAENESATMSSMGDTLAQRHSEISVELEQIKERWEIIKNDLASSETGKQELVREEERVASDIDNLRIRSSEISTTLKKYEKEIAEDNIRISRLSARMRTIEEMEANYEGYNYGVRYIMKSRIPGIRGVVGEAMSVPEGLETAIETALGGGMQNIICDSDSDAKRAINILKQNNGGRLTFLPISSVRGTKASLPSSIQNDKNFIGIASEEIKVADEHKGIFDYLLGRVVLVETLDAAIRLSRDVKGGFRLVTRDGEVINSSGAITGGRYKNASANLLTRKGEITKLEKEINLLNEGISTGKAKIKQLKVTMEETGNRIEELTGKLSGLRIDISTTDAKIDLLNNTIIDLKETKDKLENQLLNVNEDKTSSSELLEKLVVTTKDKKDRLRSLKKSLEDQISARENIISLLEKASVEKTELTIKENSINSQIDSVRSLVERLKTYTDELNERLSNRRDRLSNILSEIESLEDAKGEQDIYSLNETRKELETTIISISKEKDSMSGNLSKATREISELRQNMESLQRQKVQEEVKLAKSQTQLENLTNKLWDEFDMSLAQAAELKDPDFVMATGVKVGREVRKRIRELGDVNIGAIKEYEEVSKRYEFLKDQREDILDGMNELKSIISEMNGTIQRKFKDSFNEIVINFEEIFTELFGGGHAELTMENESDPLNSGIEIVAQPPGKKLQNINLMSGGEKTMTAIALMFAVLKAKPTPFCILDEVEAALDDNNIDRFSNYLRKFDNIQFVLVTHQKATMEHADVLYGVTMAEQGVSNLLSLKLGDAIEL
ncbi:MAG: chromosome segregation protein SMC [Clostridiales bacterium]|nr:chromosome segregation protein SMC [Clostridiales bacterium]